MYLFWKGEHGNVNSHESHKKSLMSFPIPAFGIQDF